MRLLFAIIVITACSIIFGAPLGIVLIIIGIGFCSVAKHDMTLGCLGRIIDIILLVIGVTLIIVGICSM